MAELDSNLASSPISGVQTFGSACLGPCPDSKRAEWATLLKLNGPCVPGEPGSQSLVLGKEKFLLRFAQEKQQELGLMFSLAGVAAPAFRA